MHLASPASTNLKALFSSWPATIPVFLRHRMSCVGCMMSGFDTLGETVAIYHLDWSSFSMELRAAMRLGRESDPADPA